LIDLGLHRSADGITEYTGTAWRGAITGDLLLVEFSNGDDLLLIDHLADGNLGSIRQLATGFNNPLDVTVNPSTGDIYVAEFGDQPAGEGGQVTLLRPASTGTPVARVNFQSQSAPIPPGYARDYGQAFDSTRGYGWSQDMTAYGRERNVVGDQRYDTFVHMQPAKGPTGTWEYALAPGRYTVTVGVGDPSFIDSTHHVTAEGQVAIDSFSPTATSRFRVGVVDVDVNDGRLTLNPSGGANTKIDFVEINQIESGSGDTTPPTVDVATSGTTDGSGAYQGSATVTISAADTDSGVASISYTLDGGPSTPYTSAFSVASNGSHTVVATARDGAGNTNTATKTFSVVGAAGPEIALVSPDAAIGQPGRLIFSTVDEQVRAARSITVRNDGSSTLSISNVSITGGSAGDFKLATGQATSFSVAPSASATVNVVFAPTSSGVENYSTLRITSNDPDEATSDITLAGLDANGYEGNNEPTLTQIEHVLGYTSNLGTTNRTIGKSRLPSGDELISPYWVRADATLPVQLIPVAHYSGRTTEPTGASGWFPINTSTKNQLYTFPGGSDISGGQNQRLLPGFTGSTSFTPSTAFGLYANNDFSDDAKNGAAKLHDFRAWAALDPTGAPLANSWFIGSDIGHNIDDPVKNYDFQDQVYLLVNATPAWPTATAPGAATTLDFGSAVTGTVADNDGEGTGFTSAVNGSTDASKIDLDAAKTRLALTSTAGTFSGTATSQVNALQLGFDASRMVTRLHARLLGPLTQLTAANQHQAIFFGPDRDNFAKIEAEYRSGKPHLVLYFEQNGTGSLPATPIPLPDASTISTLDLFLTLDTANGSINGSYLVNSSDFEQAEPFGPSMRPNDVMRWFSSDARAGLLVSNQNTAATFTGIFEDFDVVPAPLRGFSTINWATRATSPMKRSEAQGIAVGGKLYVFGGYKDSTFVPQVRSDVYDPATNTWKQIANLPIATTHAGVASIDGSIYVAGGYITNGGSGQIFATTNVWRYDIASNTWSASTPLPAARGSGALVALGTTLHFFGGADASRVDKGDHWILDTASGSPSWVASVALPNARSHMGYVALNGKVWAVGGQKGVDANLVTQNSVHVWDPAFPTMWIPMANLPRALSHISTTTVVADGRIVVMAGEVLHGTSISDVSAYDPISNTWRSLSPLPAKRYSGVGGWINNKLLYTGGSMSTTTYSGTPS
jgi:N-acetylneuraminic acid mutarotase